MYREKPFIQSRIMTFLFIVFIILFAELIDVLFLSTLQDFFKINTEILETILTVVISVPFIFWLFRYQGTSIEKIRENEELFRSVIQTANDAIIIADNQGKIILWNDSAKGMFGYESDEIIGKSLSILMPEKYKYSIDKITDPSANDLKIGKTLEFSGIRKDSTEFPLEHSFSTWSSRNGIFYTGILRDITKRQNTQKEIELLKHSIDVHYDGAYWLDTDNRFIYVNDAGCRALGYMQEELIGKSILDVNHKATPEKMNSVWEILRKDGFFSSESVHFRKDGSKFPVEIVSTYVQFGGREYNCGFARDITERKREQEILKKSLIMLEKALEMGKMGTWEWIIATNELIWSDETFMLYGLDRKKDHPDYGVVVNTLAAECRDNFLKDIISTIEFGQPFGREHCQIHVDGTKRHTHTKGEVLRDNEGVPVKMYGIVQDITEQRQAEEKIILFRNLIDRSNDAIFVNEPESGLILDVNERACINLGYTKEELLKMHVMDFEDKFPDQESWEEHFRVVRRKGHMIIEGMHKRKDGTVYPVEANVSFIDLEKNSYMISIVRDITERNETEQQIIHSLREKETLLREIHHRVKNNMQIISSLLGLQSNYVREEKYIEMFRECRNRINSMSLIHEKLYRSKDLVKIEFKEYVSDLANGLFQSHGTSMERIELIIDIDGVSIGIDHALTCGLIINELITNSLKYAFQDKKTGKIRISLRPIEDEKIELTVSDNGGGMPPGVDFRKMESLGLRLVIMLAENQLHGRIDLNKSKGTAFTIIFRETNNG